MHDGGLVQLGQRGHVLHAVDAAGVHRAQRLPAQLSSLEVHHLQGNTRAKRLQGSGLSEEERRRRNEGRIFWNLSVEEVDVFQHRCICTLRSP